MGLFLGCYLWMRLVVDFFLVIWRMWLFIIIIMVVIIFVVVVVWLLLVGVGVLLLVVRVGLLGIGVLLVIIVVVVFGLVLLVIGVVIIIVFVIVIVSCCDCLKRVLLFVLVWWLDWIVLEVWRILICIVLLLVRSCYGEIGVCM